ncbi:MAG: hypothetical protein JSS35_03670, partial [Proteobacteria bacterium]|nr:hypothetical protein [Pseudomonadota bacterium]
MAARALLNPSRRGFAVLATALVATAMALAFPLVPGRPQAARNEAARAAPSAPRDWLGLPRAFDARLADRLARSPLVAAAQGMRRVAGAPDLSGAGAVAGRDGFFFLRDGLRQSSGRSLHSLDADRSARVMCGLANQLRGRGAQFLFAIVPAAGEVYPEALPSSAGPPAEVTDYDLLVAGAIRCGAATLDLRSGLIAAREAGPVFRRTDEHWTPLGVLAAFNRIADSLGHPRWRLEPETLRWRSETAAEGALPRLAGLPPIRETVAVHDRAALPASATKAPLAGVQAKAAAPFVVGAGHPGPTVLILGDSFTADQLPPLLAPVAGRIA